MKTGISRHAPLVIAIVVSGFFGYMIGERNGGDTIEYRHHLMMLSFEEKLREIAAKSSPKDAELLSAVSDVSVHVLDPQTYNAYLGQFVETMRRRQNQAVEPTRPSEGARGSP